MLSLLHDSIMGSFLQDLTNVHIIAAASAQGFAVTQLSFTTSLLSGAENISHYLIPDPDEAVHIVCKLCEGMMTHGTGRVIDASSRHLRIGVSIF